MSNASKAKGSMYERIVREYLRDKGFHVDHLKQSGANDMGDLYVGEVSAVLELKNVKKILLSSFISQAEVEAANYAFAHRMTTPPTFAAVIKASGKHVGKSYVVTTLDEWMRQNGG